MDAEIELDEQEDREVEQQDLSPNADQLRQFSDLHFAALKQAFGATDAKYNAERKSLQLQFYGTWYSCTSEFTNYIRNVLNDSIAKSDYEYAKRTNLLPPQPADQPPNPPPPQPADGKVEAKHANDREQKDRNQVDAQEQALLLQAGAAGDIQIAHAANREDAKHNSPRNGKNRQTVDLTRPVKVNRQYGGNNRQTARVSMNHDALVVSRHERSHVDVAEDSAALHISAWKRHDRVRTDLNWPTEPITVHPARHRRTGHTNDSPGKLAIKRHTRRRPKHLEDPFDVPPLVVPRRNRAIYYDAYDDVPPLVLTSTYRPAYIDISEMEDDAWEQQRPAVVPVVEIAESSSDEQQQEHKSEQKAPLDASSVAIPPPGAAAAAAVAPAVAPASASAPYVDPFSRPAFSFFRPLAVGDRPFHGDLLEHRDDAVNRNLMYRFKKPAILFLNATAEHIDDWDENLTKTLATEVGDNLRDSGFTNEEKGPFGANVDVLEFDAKIPDASLPQKLQNGDYTMLFIVAELVDDLADVSACAAQTKLPVVIIDATEDAPFAVTVYDEDSKTEYLSISFDYLHGKCTHPHSTTVSEENKTAGELAITQAWVRMRQLPPDPRQEEEEEEML